jgi:hypothetical protein
VPIVPRVTRRVDTAPIPGVQVDTTVSREATGGGQSTREMFNAGQNLVNQQIQTVGAREEAQFKERERLFIQEKKRADEVAIQGLDTLASKAHTDTETKIRSMQGRDAMRAPDVAAEDWKKVSDDLKETLHNDDQKFAAEKILKAREEMLYKSAQSHAFNEIQKQDDNETSAYVASVQNEAINNAMDNERVGLSIFQQRSTLERYGKRRGLSGTVELSNKIFNAVSDTHVSVIEKRLAMGNINAARSYYEAHKDEIAGKESVKFPEYIDNYEKRLKSRADDAKKLQYDEQLRQNMLDAFSGKLTMTELQRQYRNDETDIGDYTKMAHVVADPLFSFMRPGTRTDPVAFNEIREAQLSGSKSQGEILRMIRDAGADGKLINTEINGKDVDYLIRLTNDIPPSTEDKRTDSQAKNVRDFATRYLSDNEGFFRQKFQGEGYKKEKDAKVEAMVSDFIRRVDQEGAKGERIDEIAKEVQAIHIKRDFPEINRLEDVPHIIIDSQNRIRRVLNPDQKSKLKAQYKIVPNKIEAPADKPKAKQK